MKIKLYFLSLFIVHTYCALIPNDRINTDDSNQDFSLVEGITYKIEHLKSGLNLDSDSNNIYVSSAFSPYQYWSLRKANDNEYNIVSAETNMNLDGNGQEAYISAPGDNSISNPFQHWVIKKIKNDTYNIAHVGSETRNLDSNGREVYISSPGDNSNNNLYQHWTFKPTNYKLNAVITDFEYPPDLKYKLNRYRTRTSLLSGSLIIHNPTNATVVETIDKIEKKSNSYTLKIRKSESFKVTKDIGISFNIGKTIFGLLGINTGFHGGIKREFNSTYEEEYEESVSEFVSYRVRQKVEAPPSTSIRVYSSVDKLSINVPFKAKIRVTAKANRLDEYGRVVSMADVDANALRCYLQKEYYDANVITEEGNSLIITTNGTFNVDGYGFNALIEAIPIDYNPTNPPDPNLPNPNLPNKPTDPTFPDPYDPNPPTYPNPPAYHNPFNEVSVLIYFTIYLILILAFFSIPIFFIYKYFINKSRGIQLE